ncbi:protein of unknown function (plasmid) [Azospirillum baldaniorum]|uniref:Uncharacterized protein n=1 Tax=Azospirillum baldaniorum TaxID=1064539 RepID=A0A9P1JXE7_9PROT|nr:protein of unknown function [Azospirillum baldaniorum]
MTSVFSNMSYFYKYIGLYVPFHTKIYFYW